jgi:hypothetical protein
MKRKYFVAILFFAANIGTLSASNEILLKSRRFTPDKGITSSARAKIEAIPGRAHVLIQLENIPTIRERKELEDKGIKLLSYIPNKAWFAAVPSDKVSQISSFSNVSSISEILPEDKISPIIKGGIDTININADGTVNLAVLFFEDVSLANATKTASNYGGKVYDY